MSVLLDQLAKEGSVPLERYGHQVGGHYLLFQFKDSLCKPIIPREHFFYQTAPEAIRRYVPGYYGEFVKLLAKATGQLLRSRSSVVAV